MTRIKTAWSIVKDPNEIVQVRIQILQDENKRPDEIIKGPQMLKINSDKIQTPLRVHVYYFLFSFLGFTTNLDSFDPEHIPPVVPSHIVETNTQLQYLSSVE